MKAEILANVIRGETVESIHRGHLVVMDGEKNVLVLFGGPETVTFFRSACKALQALPFVASGGADRFGFVEDEIALACAVCIPESRSRPHILQIQIDAPHVPGFRVIDPIEHGIHRHAHRVPTDDVVPDQPRRVNEKERTEHNDRRPAARPEEEMQKTSAPKNIQIVSAWERASRPNPMPSNASQTPTAPPRYCASTARTAT